METARNEEITGNILEIDANDFSYQTDEKLLVEIDRFMRRGSNPPFATTD